MLIDSFLRKIFAITTMHASQPTVTNNRGRWNARRHPNVVTTPNHSPVGAQSASRKTRSLRGRLASWSCVFHYHHAMKALQSPPDTRTRNHPPAVPITFLAPKFPTF